MKGYADTRLTEDSVGRGFARRRFIGNIKATAGAEVRYLPAELRFGRHRLAIGMEGFLEVGLVAPAC